MNHLTIREINEAVNGTLLSGDLTEEIYSVTTDSREIGEHTLFVPIVGETMDAHRFIEGALMKGAAATLTAHREMYAEWIEKHPDEKRAFILVEDTMTAIQAIGRLARTKTSLPAVGITGSVGKTTTREMVSYALSGEKKVFRTSKNYNNKLGVPLTLFELSDEDDIAVLELGMNVREELGTISALTNLNCAVITNIGVAHIEYYGTQDEIAKEKFTVTRGFWDDNPAPKMLFLNGDDPYLMKYKDSTPYPYTIYGTQENADYRAVNVHMSGAAFCFDLVIRNERVLPVKLSVLGQHNVLNAAAAIAVADYFGIDLQKASDSLSEFTGFKGRLQRFEHHGVMIIDDTYNASPASMKAGLDVLTGIAVSEGGKKYAVLGDMFELGEKSPEYHYEVGIHAAKKEIDELILVGENVREIGRACEEAGHAFTIRYESSNQAAAAYLKSVLKASDVVYLKASNGMKLREIAEELLKDE